MLIFYDENQLRTSRVIFFVNRQFFKALLTPMGNIFSAHFDLFIGTNQRKLLFTSNLASSGNEEVGNRTMVGNVPGKGTCW
jgi:hypothetical protein